MKTEKQEYQENEVVEIEWDDTQTTLLWHSSTSKYLEENDGLTRCKSVGHFLRQTEKSIQITQCISVHGSRCNTQVIPLSTITKIRRLK